MKRLVGNCVFFLIVIGIVINYLGLVASSPILAAIGSAMYIAGFLTPHIVLNRYSSKRFIWFFIWLLMCAYFAFQGYVSGVWLIAAIPFTVTSVFLHKWAGTEFSEMTVK